MPMFSRYGPSPQSGMTVLEALVAVVILGLTTTAVVSLLAVGDRIALRRSGLSQSTLLAKNEAERLRIFETSHLLPGDTLYSEVVNGIGYDVSRTRVQGDSLPRDSVVMYGEYEVSVKRKTGPALAVSFRLLQGFYGEPMR
jgi:Tfp pilus assembly protein PilV